MTINTEGDTFIEKDQGPVGSGRLSRKSEDGIASQSKSLAISMNQEKMKVELFRNREEGSLRCYSPRCFSRPGGRIGSSFGKNCWELSRQSTAHMHSTTHTHQKKKKEKERKVKGLSQYC